MAGVDPSLDSEHKPEPTARSARLDEGLAERRDLELKGKSVRVPVVVLGVGEVAPG